MQSKAKKAIGLGIIVALLTGGIATSNANAATRQYSLFRPGEATSAVIDSDARGVELGVKFQSTKNGSLSAIRFYKAPGDPAKSHAVSLWNANGNMIANEVISKETASGWQEVKLSKPVSVKANTTYTASFHTTKYMSTPDYFKKTKTSGPLSAVAGNNGVYTYNTNTVFPSSSWRSSNYWVDVVLNTTSSSTSTSTPSSTSSTSSTSTSTTVKSTTTSTTSAPTTTPPATVPTNGGGGNSLNLPRVAWNGGPSYYAQFANSSGMSDPNYFPLGVWFEGTYGQNDIDLDKGAGLNTYVELTSGSNMPLIKQNGMHAITGGPISGYGSETNGWLISDEADMNFGAGNDQWNKSYADNTSTWNSCIPIQDNGGKCGFTAMSILKNSLPKDGRAYYSNYGKGVMFWDSDADAAKFVNDYTNIVSSDVYWYTDNNVCQNSEGPSLISGSGPVSQYTGMKNLTDAECHRAANYGATMDRMNKLDASDGKRQAVWAFIEDGHPFTESNWGTITGPQLQGAVMSSIIHEARGIIYFNHDFGGSCISQHVLRDNCGAAVRPYVTTVNQHITALAPVLNTQSYQWTFNSNVDTMLKEYGGSYYIFAAPGLKGATGSQTFTLPTGLNGSTVQVLNENRTLPISGGKFTDSFAAEYSYHIYKITP